MNRGWGTWLCRTAAALLLIGGGTATAQELPSMRVLSGQLSFDANATLGAFTGTTSSLSGELTGAASLEGVRGWVTAPSRSLVTGNDRRDRDMYSSLEADSFPSIRFDLDSIAVRERSGDSVAVTLRGRFTIHGVARADTVPGWIWFDRSTARFVGRTPMNLKHYRIGGLSKMLGILRMREDIAVTVDVMFQR